MMFLGNSTKVTSRGIILKFVKRATPGMLTVPVPAVCPVMNNKKMRSRLPKLRMMPKAKEVLIFNRLRVVETVGRKFGADDGVTDLFDVGLSDGGVGVT